MITSMERAYRAHLPLWIREVYPDALAGQDLTALPTSYLQALYPDVATYGTRAKTYLMNLARIETLLDTPGHNAFLDAAFSAVPTMGKVIDHIDILPRLMRHSNTIGHPVRGAEILHGLEFDNGGYPEVYNLLGHPLITIDATRSAAFDEFLYQFTLLGIHRDFFTSCNEPHATAALREYATFCKTWGLHA